MNNLPGQGPWQRAEEHRGVYSTLSFLYSARAAAVLEVFSIACSVQLP